MNFKLILRLFSLFNIRLDVNIFEYGLFSGIKGYLKVFSIHDTKNNLYLENKTKDRC